MAAEAVLRTPETRPALAPAHPVQRWVWRGRYGSMVIEVRGLDIFVNGQRVIPAASG